MASVHASEKQNLLDIAIWKCGSPEAAFALALKNDLAVTDDLTPGQVIELPEVFNADVARYFNNKGIVPATGMGDEVETIIQEGISIWAIGVDFEVS